MVEYEVADRVGSLDRVGVGIEGFEEPIVFLLDEVSRFLVSPELIIILAFSSAAYSEDEWTNNIFIVMVQIHTCSLPFLPFHGNGRVDVGLVDNLWY